MSLERLYQLGESLSKGSKNESEYSEILSAVKSLDWKAKKLSSQFIARFFPQFPSLANQSLDSMLDLCEDEDVQIRIQAIRDLPALCRENKTYHPKIVDVLAQLLQSTDETETAQIEASLNKLFAKDPKATLIGLFSQVKSCPGGGIPLRENILTPDRKNCNTPP